MDGYFQAEDSLLVQRAFMGATVLVVEGGAGALGALGLGGLALSLRHVSRALPV